MDRSEYLRNIWFRYPAMPTYSSAHGRIYSLDRDFQVNIELEMTLERDGQFYHVEFAKAPIYSEFLVEGDIVAVISAEAIMLLSPALQALPIKKYDHELQRHWNHYLSLLRDFFSQQGFHEVKTPTLVCCPGTEPSLDVFSTDLKIGSQYQKLFLPTSPELHLKKVLASGAEKIFEIATCFRNGEVTTTHQPEFQMLEWYRAYANSSIIKKDVENLVVFLASNLDKPKPQKVRSYAVSDLFKKYCNFNLTPQTSLQELKSLAEKLKVDVCSAESIDDYFFLIFMDKIENQLPADELVFVEKYPPYQAALARLTNDGWGDRFEVYWQGMELANAFHELNDPVIQRMRTQEDLQKKKHMGKTEVPVDQQFMQTLEAGLPPSAGIALGLERLFMAFYSIKKISDLKLFPF